MSSEEVEKTAAAEESMGGGGGGRRLEGLMRWEKFLPKIALRILLVEPDDSTSQIVAALLRKCSYRVAVIPDGLKAWEIIKGSPHNIDLILTEADLPSISGYALLTLIMEHEICKNIPVIMMSAQDSVSTVYKCMLRGAADYLVKPLRRNEMRNLWQHVWRRQSSLLADGNSPQDGSVGQQKLDAASENISASNETSYVKRDCDQTQSSCTRPDMEVESGDSESLVSLLQKKDANPTIANEDVEQYTQMNAVRNISGNAFDFIAAFRSSGSVTNHATSTFDSALKLDLSLRTSSRTSVPENPSSTGEKSIFRASTASAFTRYVNMPIQIEVSSEASGYSNYISPTTPNVPPRRTSATPWPHKSSNCNSIPANGIRFQNRDDFETFSKLATPFSRSSTSPHEPSSSLNPFQHPALENGVSGNQHNQADSDNNKWDHKPDTLDNKARISPTVIYDANVDQVPAIGANADNKTGDWFLPSSGKSQQSIQREMALTKFRMKRKDRCFEKKVRYESRKKLAEQRPRVKGQFVRQVNVEPAAEAERAPTAT